MHFDWTSSSRHCSSAAEIFHFRLIRIHSNARNSIKFNCTSQRCKNGCHAKFENSRLFYTYKPGCFQKSQLTCEKLQLNCLKNHNWTVSKITTELFQKSQLNCRKSQLNCYKNHYWPVKNYNWTVSKITTELWKITTELFQKSQLNGEKSQLNCEKS